MPGVSIALEQEGDQPVIEPWVTPDQLDQLGDGSVDLSSVCAVATEILFALSGRQFGVREKTIRPTSRDSCWGIGANASLHLVLPGPVREIIAVTLDGVVLPESSYQLVERRRLLRVPFDSWPMYQRLEEADTEVDTFSVHFRWGNDVPEGGKAAALFLAKQFALYFDGKKCGLTDAQVSVTRQGVSRTYLDPSEFTRLSRTGLKAVDIWLNTVNPSGARRRSRVFSPDEPKKSRIT